MFKINIVLIMATLIVLSPVLVCGQTCPKRIGHLETIGDEGVLDSNGITIFSGEGYNPRSDGLISGMVRSIGFSTNSPFYWGLCESNASAIYTAQINSLVFSQNHLFCGIGDSYCVLDVLNPASLTLLGCNTPIAAGHSALNIAARGNYIFSGVTDTIYTLDASVPGNVQVVSQKSIEGNPTSLSIQGSYLYAAINNGPEPAKLIIFDVSNGLNIVEKGTCSLPSSWAEVVTAQGSLAFVGIIEGTSWNNGLVAIVDVSDPMAPQTISTINAGICGVPGDLAINGSFLGVALSNCGVKLFDISIPSNPQYLARYISQGSVKSLAFAGPILAVLNRNGKGIEFLDLSACGTTGTPPSAAFTYNPTNPQANEIVNFTDASTGNPTSWDWVFGDGGTSTAQTPSHVYASAGNYSVTLTATNSYGSSGATQNIIVAAPGLPPTANFNWTPPYPVSGQSINFEDQSINAPTTWIWNFGDGGTSALQNPTHIYVSQGIYIVMLSASNGFGSNTISKTVTVGVAPISDFSWTPTNPLVGDTIQFLDQSSGSPTTWNWAFGDGSISIVKNPSKSYSAAGTYDVTLEVSSNYGTDALAKQISITVPCTPPAANFTWSPSTPLVGKQAQFTDTSTGTPTAWSWNFGDGRNSVLKNPMHAFATKGTYNVTLTASNACGSNSVTKAVTVKPASFP